MRLLCVVERAAASETFLARDAAALARRGHAVLTWHCAEGALAGIPFPTPPRPLTRLAAARRLATTTFRALRHAGRLATLTRRTGPPDLVLAHFASITAVCGRTLARAWGVPLVVFCHARDIFVPWRPGLRALEGAERILVCHRAGREALATLRPALSPRLALAHHALPADLFAAEALPRRTETILAAGRLVAKKGFPYLLEALARLARSRPGVRLRLAGEGPQRPALEARIRRLGVEERVDLLGQLGPDALAAERSAAALFCAPSVIAPDGDRDGIPNVVLEAMAAGLPVVACRTGGLPEVVRDGETGWLVPPEAPDALAAALAAALSRPNEARRRAEQARRLMRETFHEETAAATQEALLTEALAAATGPPRSGPA